MRRVFKIARVAVSVRVQSKAWSWRERREKEEEDDVRIVVFAYYCQSSMSFYFLLPPCIMAFQQSLNNNRSLHCILFLKCFTSMLTVSTRAE